MRIICDVCLKLPCDSRCPNAEEPPIITYCKYCNTPIRVYDDYLDDQERVFCDWECLQDYYTKHEFVVKKTMEEWQFKELKESNYSL